MTQSIAQSSTPVLEEINNNGFTPSYFLKPEGDAFVKVPSSRFSWGEPVFIVDFEVRKSSYNNKTHMKILLENGDTPTCVLDSLPPEEAYAFMDAVKGAAESDYLFKLGVLPFSSKKRWFLALENTGEVRKLGNSSSSGDACVFDTWIANNK